ncbi:MAG: hypothetical protein V3U75_09030 [Methylococcaceae bacterium]
MENVGKQETSDSTSNGAVDKIRDLLFGSQMDNYDQHFQYLESMIATEARKSLDEMNTRLIALETSFVHRIEKTETALENEQKQRVEGLNTVHDQLQKSFEELHNALEQLEADSNQNILTIKSSMEQHKQNLLDQITTLRSDSIQSLKDETKRLEGQTVNRQQLRDLLARLSSNLASE